jgi:hypothetical protein
VSLASEALAEGFSALLAASGETLTFRGLRIVGVVDRFTEEPEPGPGKIDLNARETSAIEILWSDLPDHPRNENKIPASGESFVDEFGYSHRVQKSRRLGFRVRCECLVSS